MKLVRGETSYIEYILHFSLRKNNYNHGFIAELTFLLNILAPVADRLGELQAGFSTRSKFEVLSHQIRGSSKNQMMMKFGDLND